ncbi:MAG TPA: GPW/gp25 family protein [Pyrinomonadaceae bacterium]|jgi:phage baseplate assembly protein W|nr:GPW/gp25 family protein [Pyrinomonadaceae bacterium]
MRLVNGKHLSFPFRVSAEGRMETVKTLEDHVRDELVQLILTNQGERPFLVDFGGDVRRLVFEAANDATGSIAKANLTQMINRWLGHRVKLEYIDVKIEGASILVDIRYSVAGTQDSRVLRFQRGG